jgi:hypothetical protein
MHLRSLRAAAAAIGLLVCSAQSSALEIVFRDITPGGMSAPVRAAFDQAASIWGSLLADPVKVYIDISYVNDGKTGILGGAFGFSAVADYPLFRDALVADAKSTVDLTAVGSLAAGPGFAFLASNPDGTIRFDADTNPCPLSGPSVPCMNNNQFMAISTANGKALGFDIPTSPDLPDGEFFMNAYYAPLFDFDRSDGISAGKYDFVSVAMHEIAHVLGFESGVDIVDICTPASDCGFDNGFALDSYAVFSMLDLFRYSTVYAGVRDLRAGGPAGLSIDGGATFIQMMSTGRYNGDGYQASHFQAGPPNLMGPYGLKGISVDPGFADLTAMDAIGWDLATPIPEPETYALMLLGLGLVGWATRRQRLNRAAACACG